ncbi:SSL2 DNA or RNA helicases of superfamily II [uncultured Caudovirales phage]|uniref:SSL2 DNA or RNA helicases of superfamily II n=1 Tax=uncultured Caudovirales phage TaxID=2100421 RepID=A0A6J5KKU8_9CAUD|nr:SSL2 DNA or RNA helicases of superfamily II [uncultured Caudovirales phage]
MSLNLRAYQTAAINGIYNYFAAETGNPLVVIPTAGGKSLVMASFIEGVLKSYPDQRILIVTHVRELIEQNHAELIKLWPQAPAGIYSAGLKKREISAQILFAGIQSIHKHVYGVQQCDLVLIDEAHLIPRSSNTMYRSFLDGLKRLNPMLKVIGLTATPYRLDSGRLHEGEEAIFTDIAYEVTVRELIDDGYLSPLISKRMATELDVSEVGTRGGEFIAKDLEAAIDQDAITQSAVDEIFSYSANRKSWLIFCAGVDHAYHVRDAVRARGVTCETIVGDTPSAQREALIKDFKAGRIQCLTNANVLTTGFNAPAVDLIAMLRPTKSAGLYVQIVGRGCRLAPGKSDCLVLDFAGNIARHGPIDAIKPKTPKAGEEGEAPTKDCPDCNSIVHAAVRECPDCGHLFPEPKIKIEARASNLDILSGGPPQWVPVTGVNYARHEKLGKPPSLRVDYQSGLLSHSEWICLEHQGYPRQKAASWWANRAAGLPLPGRVDEALAVVKQLKLPAQIAVRASGRFTEIVGARF